jgi:hypothetical protein
MLSIAALVMAPFGSAGAAFSATTGATGNSWAVSGPATHLSFTSSPSSATGGVPFGTQPAVAVQAADGATVGVSSAQVTLNIVTPAGATLTCTSNPTNASAGIANFAGCRIDKAGTYTLTATSGALTTAVSASFTITAGAPTTVSVVSGSAQSATVGQAFSNPLVALVTDANANPVPGATVTFTAPATGASGTFANVSRITTAVTGANGQATSSVFTANTTAGTYSVSATATAGSTTFTLTNTP